jgi:hypothetical protein
MFTALIVGHTASITAEAVATDRLVAAAEGGARPLGPAQHPIFQLTTGEEPVQEPAAVAQFATQEFGGADGLGDTERSQQVGVLGMQTLQRRGWAGVAVLDRALERGQEQVKANPVGLAGRARLGR